ncbi:hypothetical protein ABZP36_010973 [Zizania latifolia]
MSTGSGRELPAPGRSGERSGDHRRRRLMNAESARTDEEARVASLGSSSASSPRWWQSGLLILSTRSIQKVEVEFNCSSFSLK